MAKINEEIMQRALLIGLDSGAYDAQASIDELEELARSAGAAVEGKLIQRRPSPDPATVIGEGKLGEAAEFCKNFEIDLTIFDCELSPAQMRNIERVLETAVVDRTALILDIFARRARTAEGKLQVELAQYQYRLPRLAGIGTALSRLGGGIGTRGPGETQLETDRRHIRRRIATLKDQLRSLEKRRALHRERRKKNGDQTVAIVGYTNVGKSTLLNYLTHAGVLAEDRLFATLDPTARALTLPNGENVILIDTVGFVRRLPHQLVEAFHSTLEEAVQADLVWCICDASAQDMNQQADVAEKLMRDLGVTAPVLTILNKCDLVAGDVWCGKEAIRISAKTGAGVDQLLSRTQDALPKAFQRLTLRVPYADGAFLGEIMRRGRIFSMEEEPDGTIVDALVERGLLQKAAPYAR